MNRLNRKIFRYFKNTGRYISEVPPKSLEYPPKSSKTDLKIFQSVLEDHHYPKLLGSNSFSNSRCSTPFWVICILGGNVLGDFQKFVEEICCAKNIGDVLQHSSNHFLSFLKRAVFDQTILTSPRLVSI